MKTKVDMFESSRKSAENCPNRETQGPIGIVTLSGAEETYPEVDGAVYMPGVYKMLMVRMTKMV